MFAPLLVCLLVLLALGGAERLARDRALRALPFRIHVNGTRAKSTVTRLIWSALSEAGIPTIAKTTGTAVRILLPDRREVSLRRRGPANIREQLEFLRHARRAGARAAVIECMALDPVLQYVAEQDMVRATIGVITNVRLDHTEVMGRDLSSIATALANTIPARGVLVTGASCFLAVFQKRAAELGTNVVVVASPPEGSVVPGNPALWLAEDTALALAVTRQLGIDDVVARRGFARAPRDPGTVREGSTSLRNGDMAWIDATAANDPESLALLLEGFEPWHEVRTGGAVRRPGILVYHHRSDRASRLECFVRHCTDFASADHLVISGARPPATVWRLLTRGRKAGTLQFVAAAGLASWLAAHASGAAVAFCGNTRGLDVPRLLEEAASCG
ncbi:MAG TPA: poly-gamma-glutamate synthase PgsB [Vicinamibacterales bacterium]